MKLYYPITIDLYKVYPLQVMEAQQGNVGRGSIVTLTAGGAVVDPTNEDVEVYAKRPDGTVSWLECSVEDAKVKIDFTNQMLMSPGVLQVELRIKNETDDITTPIFMVQVNKSNVQNAGRSENELPLLDQIKKNADDAKAAAEAAEKAVGDKITNPNVGAVGQILAVETVDEKGKPLTYKAVDKPEGGEDKELSQIIHASKYGIVSDGVNDTVIAVGKDAAAGDVIRYIITENSGDITVIYDNGDTGEFNISSISHAGEEAGEKTLTAEKYCTYTFPSEIEVYLPFNIPSKISQLADDVGVAKQHEVSKLSRDIIDVKTKIFAEPTDNLLRFAEIEYTSEPSDLTVTTSENGIKFEYDDRLNLIAWIPVTLEIGKMYTFKFDRAEGGVYGANYGNIRLFKDDKSTQLLQFSNVTEEITNFEKTFEASYQNCYLRIWYPYHNEFTPDFFELENVWLTLTSLTSKTENDISEYLKEILNRKYESSTFISKIENRYRYLVPTFYGTEQAGLILLGSNDLRNFDLISGRGIYEATKEVYGGLVNTIRDPAIIKIEDYFYLTYTAIGLNTGADCIGFCRTKDFEVFEELENLSVSNGSDNYDKIWAPSWFRDNEKLYIISTAHVTNGNYTTVICEYDVKNHTLAIGHTITEVGNGIDYHMYHENNMYYIVGAGGQIWKSETITGTYTMVSRLEGTNYEADFCVKLDNGKWRVFMQQLSNNLGTAHMCYADIDSFEDSISELNLVNYTSKALEYIDSINYNYPNSEYFHWTIYDLKNGNDNNNYFVT